jgi:UDP-N-acetylmuramate--alanine ligase
MDAEKTTSLSVRQANDSFAGLRVHMIGIGGSGMRAVASMLQRQGAIVSGSDAVLSSTIQRLEQEGVDVQIGHQGGNIPDHCDIVVYSVAVHEQNPELVRARERGVQTLKYSQMLGALMESKVGVAIAGTHGKSTTTGMLAYAIRHAGLDPSYIVGASVGQLGGPSDVGAGKHFVAEACEYDRSFLNLSPKIGVILNIEEDHLDCYRDIDDIVEAFKAFAGRVDPEGLLVLNGEDRHCQTVARSARCEVQTFGMSDDCDWQGHVVRQDRGRVVMNVTFRGEPFCRITTPLAGLHNAYNTLACIAVLYHTGIEFRGIPYRLQNFKGAHRRMTFKGAGKGIHVVDDFAHHPTEIQATLRALREAYDPKRLICVFQPHQHSRTRFLLKDFARSFGAADEVILPDIYFVRDSAREKDHISASDLAAQIRLNGGTAQYLQTFERIIHHLQEHLRDGDLLVTMGAGDVWEIANEIVQWLGIDR